jgi:creatinine amidohydrolase
MSEMARREFLLGTLTAPALWEGAQSGLKGESAPAQPKRFDTLGGFELADAIEQHPLAIVPTGSLEFHGPHNPLGVDSIIISGIAERVAMRTNALLFPTVRFTHCPAHTAHFRGTLSMRPEVMTLYFEDILRSIVGLGFNNVFMLNGHDGNIGPGRGAISKVAAENPHAALMFASWWEALPGEEMAKLNLFHQSNGGHGHGGPLETSAVAAFRPDLIHLEKSRDLPEPPDLSGVMPYYLEKATAEDWPGYSGRVSESSPEKGKRLVKLSEDRLVQLVKNWLGHPSEPGSW